MKRSSGILLHISSLPSDYGIGTMGKAAYEFVDFLAGAKQEYWQVLPLTPTSFGDSPYQSPSTFAGNEYFIDLDLLKSDGLLTADEIESVSYGRFQKRVDYETLFYNRFTVLWKAFDRFDVSQSGFQDFLKDKNIFNYALYKALKYKFNQLSWHLWDDKYKFRDENALDEFSRQNNEEILYWQFLQFIFSKQWRALKAYANNKGVKIFGDMPIYIAYDSVEVWMNNDLVQLDKNLDMTLVAGVPPDCFTEDGQLWGNPVYNWDYMKKTGFDWWKKRLVHSMELFDLLRIDHFRGFEKYYVVENGKNDARVGEWLDAKGIELFREAEKCIPNLNIIAEDLGFIDEPCRQMFKTLGYPGMKILQFGFDGSPDNEHHPRNYTENFVVYTGTHDNEPLMMAINKMTKARFQELKEEVGNILKDMGLPSSVRGRKACAKKLVEIAFASKAVICIIPMQDLLLQGEESRMNLPATISTDNWAYRIEKPDLSQALCRRLIKLTGASDRL